MDTVEGSVEMSGGRRNLLAETFPENMFSGYGGIECKCPIFLDDTEVDTLK